MTDFAAGHLITQLRKLGFTSEHLSEATLNESLLSDDKFK